MTKIGIALGLLWFSLCVQTLSADTNDEIHWIDVRTLGEYALGHIEGATRIPFDSIGAGVAALGLEKEAVIYLYCGSGGRAEQARQTLVAEGYTGAINVGGLADARQRLREEE